MVRNRRSRILATLGPSSSTPQRIHALVQAGVDVFRLNFSHGSHEDHAERYRTIRAVERDIGRPIGVLMDLQGPKLRIGRMAGGKAVLEQGSRFRLDLDPAEGDAARANLPHPEIFAALEVGTALLLDDGKLRLRVDACGPEYADTTVITGGVLSDRKGVNVPGVVLPISPLTAKDRADLAFGLELGVDWVALSFVQRPEDITEARALIGDKAWIMAKLEKPAAIDALTDIVALADGIMVARGDLGVELPAHQVPVLQRRIVHAARAAGKPVVVATQMLESMIAAPVPTRAEVSDVATAIYDGADAVMLSAESASGQFPLEAVVVMDSVMREVEQDPGWRAGLDASHTPATASTADAICCALRRVARLIEPAVTVTYTFTGASCLRASRERPDTPILALTPQLSIARRLSLAWGVHPVPFDEARTLGEMVTDAAAAAVSHGLAKTGDDVVIVAGFPAGHPGSTNLLHVVRIGEDPATA
ncbi:pyruvate kinase [Pseudoduganella buxea]|uniref:Pyruvate kinase n=1 Tax=Pseudoduganella buxea TaxID=1949069 RepID=A0A6I3T065_9BURK|nr:pyruvate kinase [Pseudoduganella buxea]MTV53137.1 pyruvate kinase [Pseudoduganella buxea]GGC00394.1 pyruvate kinase [Pseudoduganella buxea]